MFDQLVESRPERTRGAAQTIVSIAIHTLVIAISIQLTRAVAMSVASRPIEQEMLLTRAPLAQPTRAVARTAASNSPVAPMLTLPPALVVVPTGIPPIETSRPFDLRNFNTQRTSRDSVPGMPNSTLVPDANLAIGSPQADEPAEYLSGPQPVYPSALRQVGIEGAVLLRYIVGIDGRAEPGSIVVTTSSNPAFATPAIEAIRSATFRPARIRGRVVRQIVEQVVRFTLGLRPERNPSS